MADDTCRFCGIPITWVVLGGRRRTAQFVEPTEGPRIYGLHRDGYLTSDLVTLHECRTKEEMEAQRLEALNETLAVDCPKCQAFAGYYCSNLVVLRDSGSHVPTRWPHNERIDALNESREPPKPRTRLVLMKEGVLFPQVSHEEQSAQSAQSEQGKEE